MNVYIGGAKDYSAMQGPAPEGFHIPLTTEWEGLKTIMDGLGLTTGDSWRINLHMPFAGARNSYDASIYSQGSDGYYWASSPYDSTRPELARNLYINLSTARANSSIYRARGLPVRCFKDSYVTADSSWTVITGTVGSAGIFWNQTEGLISITDGTTGYTIQDKNLGATAVYNDGNTLTQANMGKMYQWGNNYGFSSTGSITTSSTLVNAGSYGPGNYYSSSTFIKGSNDWSSVTNDNLRGGVTGIVSPAELKNAYIGEFVPYTPNANTLLYLPFNGDLSNSQGKSITGSGIAYEDGGVNKVVKLTSTSGSITGPGNLMSSVGTGDYTVSFWIKPTNGGNALALAFGNWYEADPYPGVLLFFVFGTAFEVTNKVLLSLEGGNICIASTMGATTLVGSWHNIVATRRSGTNYLYIDNVLQGQVSWGTSLSNFNSLIILNRVGGQSWSNAGVLMDELIVEKAGWTVNDISNYYNLTKSSYGL